MATTTRTVVREFDAKGNLVKETETVVTRDDPPPYVPPLGPPPVYPAYPRQWWRDPLVTNIDSASSTMPMVDPYKRTTVVLAEAAP